MTTVDEFYNFIVQNGFCATTAMDIAIDAASYWSVDAAEMAIKKYIKDHSKELSLDEQDDFFSEFYNYLDK